MIRYAADISLPDVRLNFSAYSFSEEYLLVAGGRAPSSVWLREAAQGRTIYSIDRGADACRAASIMPFLHLGDGDSITADTWDWIKESQIETKQFPSEKDKTDTQLALDLLAGKQDAFVILSGGFGGRFDHAFSLLYALVGANLHGCLADEREFLLILQGEDEVSLQLSETPKSISLLPLSSVCRGVGIAGVHWPLSDATLYQKEPYAISNRLESEKRCVIVKNGEGILGLYLCWNESAPLK